MLLVDLVFLLLFFCGAAALLASAWFALRGERARARRTLFGVVAGAGLYMAVVVSVSLLLPRRIVQAGQSQCFDDWCIAVVKSTHDSEGAETAFRVDLRLFSRAKRAVQRERHIAVYLTDREGRRYDPVARTADGPFDVLLAPRESVTVRRSFRVPSAAREVAAVITHEGGFPIGWLIIGYDSWFRKPPIAMLE